MGTRHPRVAVGEWLHESHSFSPRLTTLEDFRNALLYSGGDAMTHMQGTRTGLGGFLDGLRKHLPEGEILPLLAAHAVPAGTVTRHAYETINAELLERLESVMPVDGVLLALHGAMMAEGIPDAEGEILRAVRRLVGANTPVVVTLDMHGNVSQAMVEAADVIIGYQTYPHVDMYERGLDAVKIWRQMLDRKVYPVNIMEKPPMMPPSMNMTTDSGPMAELQRLAAPIREEEGMLAVSIFGGYPYADFPDVGLSVVVTADSRHRERGREVARTLAEAAWRLRRDFIVDLPNVAEAVAQAIALDPPPGKPVVLVDVADNPGSAGSADTPSLLAGMLDAGMENAAFAVVADPESVSHAEQMGVGSTGHFRLGGKVTPEYGPPVAVEARVLRVGRCSFKNVGPMARGMEVHFGRAALLQVQGIQVIVTEHIESPRDPALLSTMGVDITALRFLGMKAKNHWRAGFAGLVGPVIAVDAPGVASLNLKHFTYHNLGRPMFPLDLE